mmetsp:Transcript_67994/g.208375  ORF Transcript_67994/g.208375 Transcript_67994/m.208375 type:complete len:205 (+) Transcript_67994:1244-1858(+)
MNSQHLTAILAPRQILDVAQGAGGVPVGPVVLLQRGRGHGVRHGLLELDGLGGEGRVPPSRGRLGPAVREVPELAELGSEYQYVEAHQAFLVRELIQDREGHFLRPVLRGEIPRAGARGLRSFALAGLVGALGDLRQRLEPKPLEDALHPPVPPRGVPRLGAGALQGGQVPGVHADDDVVLEGLELALPERAQRGAVGEEIGQP